MRHHAFFEQPKFQRLLGHDFLKITRFPTQIFDLSRRRRTGRIARKPLLTSFKELLGPAVVQAMGDALAATQFRNAILTLQAVQHDPDLLLGRILFACRATDGLDDLLAMALLGSVVRGKRPTGAFSEPSNSVSSPLLGGYDVPETLSYQITLNCPIGADVRQRRRTT